MRRLMFVTLVAAVAVLVVPVQARQTVLMTSGWESDGTGCGLTPLLDGGAWNDYGGSGICTEGPAGGPAALVTASEHNSGAHALQVIQMPGNINGTDFREVRYLSSRITTTSYYRWYYKVESTWTWSPGNDHKMLITGPVIGGIDNQHIYCNVRGNPGGTTAYVAIHLIVPDSVVRGDITINRGVWTLFELAVTWGASGSVQAKVNGVLLNLSQEAGNPVNPANFTNSAGADFVKMDSTYNNGAAISAPMNQYWDDVQACSVTWCGGTGGGGGSTGTPRYRIRKGGLAAALNLVAPSWGAIAHTLSLTNGRRAVEHSSAALNKRK